MRRFIHVEEHDGRAVPEVIGKDVALVADGWAYLAVGSKGQPDMPITADTAEALPIILVGIVTEGGFKVYWGTNIQTEQMVLEQGIRLRHEAVARTYFPMFKDVKFYDG